MSFLTFGHASLSPISLGVDVSEMQELGVLQGGGKALGIRDSCMAS